MDIVRVSCEISTRIAPPTLDADSTGETLLPFKNLVGTRRQQTIYGDNEPQQPTYGGISSTFLKK